MADPQGRVLIIAGSDPSGGAGIQADLKSVTMLGAYGMTAITALTVQNTVGVTSVLPIVPGFVQQQIEACVSDIGADVIKVGMLSDSETIKIVEQSIADLGAKLVLDPVMVATSGDRLLKQDAVQLLINRLIPKAYVITPNIPEAEVLTGMAISSPEDMERAGRKLQEMGAENVLMKGGHLDDDELVDLLLSGDTVIKASSVRIDTRHTHGTGCTLASSLAARLSQGDDLKTAFLRAREFTRSAIKKAPGFGKGCGPLGHAWAV